MHHSGIGSQENVKKNEWVHFCLTWCVSKYQSHTCVQKLPKSGFCIICALNWYFNYILQLMDIIELQHFFIFLCHHDEWWMHRDDKLDILDCVWFFLFYFILVIYFLSHSLCACVLRAWVHSMNEIIYIKRLVSTGPTKLRWQNKINVNQCYHLVVK